ncbi:MAG: hypothetical protein KDD51_13650 [Bdellovibrionales bacterium]|nr:hypothetical protein [Bdellovibrionales bacterium]
MVNWRKFPIFAVSIVLAIALSGCGGAQQSSGSCSISTDLIKGPAVGSGGNNSDNPFRALAIDPTDPQTIYVGSEGNGVFKSSDGGANYTWLRSGLKHCDDAYPEIYSIAIDSTDRSRIAIATNAGPGPVTSGHSATAGVYYSTDSGASWSQINTGLPNGDVNSIAIVGSKYIAGLGAGTDTNSRSTFYAGGIYTRSFSASSWTKASAPSSADESIYWQIAQRASGLITFGGNPITGSGSASGVITSTDSGNTWSQTTSPLNNLAGGYIEASSDLQTIYACKRSGEADPVFYKSTDGGANWTNPAQGSSGPVRLVIPTHANVALYSIGQGIAMTTDGFTTASTVLTTPSASNDVMAIEVAPSNSNYIYAVTKGLLVYRSTDAGANWTLRGNIRTYIDSQ